jgi:uncharacterized protein YjdB
MNIGNCDNANTGKEFEIAEGEKLECPVCHKEMVIEVNDTPWLKMLIIAATIAILGGASFGIYSLIGGGSEIDKIKLDKKNITLVVGQRDVIKATVVDKDGKEITDAKVVYKWTVKDEKVASVTQGGEVAALKKGKTSVTVKIEGDDKHRATCQIDVKVRIPGEGGEDGEPSDVLITNLSVANSKISLKEGEQAEIKLTVEPSNHTESIFMESSDSKVAVVEDGIIKAKNAGSAQIMIKTEKSGKSATINVTVTKKEKDDDGNGWGKENLGYGIYEGYRKNHKPHGHGTIRYTTTHQIVSWKDFTASPGDTFEGEFREGKITGMGYWKHNGNVTAIQ